MISPETITESHRSRTAIIYVRQSTEEQVVKNTASQLYQRGQKRYALEYGWDESKIEMVEDLGQSASTTGNRLGYESILTRIERDEIGAVFFHDLSRLTRNPADFQLLLVRCGKNPSRFR